MIWDEIGTIAKLVLIILRFLKLVPDETVAKLKQTPGASKDGDSC